jgi:hypothetical protein
MGRPQREFPSDKEAGQSIREATSLILRHRQSLGFMTIARAMIVSAATKDPRCDISIAANLGISPQTHHQWLHEELDTWLDHWRTRLEAVARAAPPPVRRVERLTEPDLKWIARVIQGAPVSWEARAKAVRRAAGADPDYGHLRKISRATLWRRRRDLWVTMSSSRASGGSNNGNACPN